MVELCAYEIHDLILEGAHRPLPGCLVGRVEVNDRIIRTGAFDFLQLRTDDVWWTRKYIIWIGFILEGDMQSHGYIERALSYNRLDLSQHRPELFRRFVIRVPP